MGANRAPHRTEIAEKQFPVRITVLAEGTIHDHGNQVVSRWLQRNLGDGGFRLSTAITWSGRRAVHIHLPTVYDAAALLLACPSLRLHGETYDEPAR